MIILYILAAYIGIGFGYAKYASSQMRKFSPATHGGDNLKRVRRFELSVFFCWWLFMWIDIKLYWRVWRIKRSLRKSERGME